jgi:ABC-type branched-subunit amino acid transport system substrate-binding protein
MRADRVRRLVLADDRALAGASLADRVARAAARAGIEVVRRLRLHPDDDPEDGVEVPGGLGADVRAERAHAFLYAGAYRPFALAVLRAVHAASPRLRLYGTDDLALAPRLPAQAGRAGRRLLLTGVRPPAGPEAAEFARRYAREYGERPHPQAVLGYQAMRLVLDAVRAAGPAAKSRRRVIREALGRAGSPGASFARFTVDGSRLLEVRSRR